MSQARHGTDVGCGDAGGGLQPDTVDAGDALAQDMGVEQVLDIVLGLGQAAAPDVEVLADVLGLQLVGGAVVLADRTLGGLDQGLGQFGSGEVPAIVAQPGGPARGGTGEGVGGGIFGEQAGGEHAVEAAEVAGEFGKAKIDQAVQLAHAIVEILTQPVALADQLAERLGDLVMQMGGRGALFEGQAGEAGGIDGVGLGALQAGLLEAAGDQRVEKCDVVAGGGEYGEEIFSVVDPKYF